MRLLEEIFSMLGGEDPARIAYTVSPGGGHFRNVKRVAEFSPQRIIFRGRRGGVSVEGEGLSLEHYEGGDGLVRGAISRVENLEE